MQCSISRPVEITGHDLGDACAVSGHERDTHCTFSIHFDNASQMVAFGRILVAEGRRLADDQQVLGLADVTPKESLGNPCERIYPEDAPECLKCP